MEQLWWEWRWCRGEWEWDGGEWTAGGTAAEEEEGKGFTHVEQWGAFSTGLEGPWNPTFCPLLGSNPFRPDFQS